MNGDDIERLRELMSEEVRMQKRLDGVFVSDFARGMEWMVDFVNSYLDAKGSNG